MALRREGGGLVSDFNNVRGEVLLVLNEEGGGIVKDLPRISQMVVMTTGAGRDKIAAIAGVEIHENARRWTLG